MNANRDETRIVRSWLEAGATQLPDRVLDAVLDQLPKTTQRRRSWLARRLTIMNTTTVRYGLAAAAVVILLLFGIRFAVSNDASGPATAPTPTATPTSSSPALPQGTVIIGQGFLTTVEVTAQVPDGWTQNANFIKGNGVGLSAWTTDGVFKDPCRWRHSLTSIEDVSRNGPAEQIAALLATQLGRHAKGPKQVTLGGWGAERLSLSVPADLDLASCDLGRYKAWTDVSDPDFAGGGNWNHQPGQIDVVYVISIDRAPPVIVDVWHQPDATPQSLAELKAVVDSIAFDYQ